MKFHVLIDEFCGRKLWPQQIKKNLPRVHYCVTNFGRQTQVSHGVVTFDWNYVDAPKFGVL